MRLIGPSIQALGDIQNALGFHAQNAPAFFNVHGESFLAPVLVPVRVLTYAFGLSSWLTMFGPHLCVGAGSSLPQNGGIRDAARAAST